MVEPPPATGYQHHGGGSPATGYQHHGGGSSATGYQHHGGVSSATGYQTKVEIELLKVQVVLS